MSDQTKSRRRKRAPRGAEAHPRQIDYTELRSPFPIMKAFSDDRIAAIHTAALNLLETAGIKVLLPEARQILKSAGASVDDESQMVRIGREIVRAALATAPRRVVMKGGRPERDVTLELGRLVFQPGGGTPHASDRLRGRRPGTGRDFRELVQLTHHFDALQMVSALLEPQDIAPSLRHYFMIEAQLTLMDKSPFVYGRGSPQVRESFEMIRDFRGLSDAAFAAEPWSYTVINTNSPRQIDIPMAQGLIDFARHGQMVIVTPFTLMGAMAPITVAGAMTLSHAEALAALAAGFADVTLLPGPKTERPAMEAQVELARAMAGETVAVLDTTDPDALSDALFDAAPPAPLATPVRPIGTRRQIARQSARALNPGTETLPLPEGAPYGAVLVDTKACTLCLSCVSLCPSGALGDNPDLPQLRFQEDACLQCGLCANVCPEDAITYAPRLDLTEAALSQRVLNEEEPFACIECGALFGVKSSVERIMAKLEGHAMFTGDKLRMIQMCDDCRVQAQFHSTDNPFSGGERPRVRTTDDYLSKRRDH